MFQLLLVLGRHKQLVFGLSLLVGALALGISYLLPIQYRTSVIIAGSKEGSASVLRGLAESSTVRDRVVERLSLAERFGTDGPSTARVYEQRVTVRPGRDGLLFVTAVDRDPVFVARMVDTIAQETVRLAHERRISLASQQMNRIDTRLRQLDQEAKVADKFLAQEGIKDWRTALSDADRTLLATLAELQAEVNLAQSHAVGRENGSSVLFLQDRLSFLMRQLTERRTDSNRGLNADAFGAIKDHFYIAALRRGLEQQRVIVASDMADEIKPVAPAPVPLVKDSPKRAPMGVAGALVGLGLGLLAAFSLTARANADPAQRARSDALRAAWGWSGRAR